MPDSQRAAGGGPFLDAGDGITMRPLLAEDVTQAYVDGLNDRAVNTFLLGPRSSRQTIETVRAFVEQNQQDPAAILFGIFKAGRHFGNVRLHDISQTDAWIGVAVFDTGEWRKGLGSRCVARAARFAVADLGLERVNAGIDRHNERSKKAFARAGFQLAHDGRTGAMSHDGEHWVYTGRE
tara:strand:- start:15 stop:554 length:540 start_codon:yes stop_codon:yes gene_type:complete